ncbi:MAG: hypothetical protein CL968_01435 [Euryarchaeota archaeon]|nr:hypothetical protein [Euryarchaeota archaeon]
MGKRSCAVPSCTAIEFRETGYCHRHQDLAEFGELIKNDAPPNPIIISTGITGQSANLLSYGFTIAIIGLIVALLGSLDWVCCGLTLIIIGGLLGGYDVLSNMLRPGPRAGQHTIQRRSVQPADHLS